MSQTVIGVGEKGSDSKIQYIGKRVIKNKTKKKDVLNK